PGEDGLQRCAFQQQQQQQRRKNVVIIGGSYTAVAACYRARQIMPPNYRIIVLEKHSHLHFMFAFPRAIVLKGFEHELFVPYTNLFDSKDQGLFFQALATSISPTHITLDHPYDYLIYAAGASHPEPTSLCDANTKTEGIDRLKYYQDTIAKATSVLVCGGGAAGLETASEIKEHYPDKEVTLVHSRERYMMPFNYGLHQKSYDILEKLGVNQVLGERVVVPEGGFVHDGVMKIVKTTAGREIECDLQVSLYS
ncbi:hypothetical protein BC829DRAFT_397259, partial [Chytridium lagenaria]